MIGFIILTVFVAGLMIGRTPEYLRKKIDAFDIKMVLLITLITPFCVLIFSSIAILFGNIENSVSSNSAYGFSQILYYFMSAGANNGSSLLGFNGNITFINILTGICMLISRIVPIYGTLKLSESLSQKRLVATIEGTLSTSTPLFVGMLIDIIIIIGGLSFLPALALGPLAEIY